MGKAHKTAIGGQALLEGIMMRSSERTAAVVRGPDGIVTRVEDNKPSRFPFVKLPFLRGVPAFVASMRQGMTLLYWSAEFFPEDEEPGTVSGKTKEQSSAPAPDSVAAEAESGAQESTQNAETESRETETETERRTDSPPPEGKDEAKKPGQEGLPGFAVAVSLLLALVLAIGLFTVLPTFLGGLLAPVIGSGFWRNLAETLLRLVILLLYLFVVSRQKSIRRTFMYHGAEHKTIACYEAGEELVLANVRKHSRFHPRCGTSFLLTVVIISLFVFMLASSIFPFLPWGNPFLRVLFRLALLPIVVSVSYEFNRLVGRYDNPFTIFFRSPGILLQRFTTVEPDDDMIEVGIHALSLVLPKDAEADAW